MVLSCWVHSSVSCAPTPILCLPVCLLTRQPSLYGLAVHQVYRYSRLNFDDSLFTKGYVSRDCILLEALILTAFLHSRLRSSCMYNFKTI